MGGLIDMERKGCDHGIGLCVTMMEWVNVPASDRGEFRRRHTIGISSQSRYRLGTKQATSLYLN